MRQSAGYIIEDDYDSEFRFKGSPISSLQSLDPERVIYVGTFSKILYPALRIGYIILPNKLIDSFCIVKHLEDLHSPILEQLTLAQFIKEHFLDRHINITKKIYHRKSLILQKNLQEAFGKRVKIIGNSAGIHLVAEFEGIYFTETLLRQLQQAGVNTPCIDEHAIHKGLHTNKIMLGYGNLSEEQIVEGVKRILNTLPDHIA